MKIIQQIPFAALGMGAAFTILWGVADPIAAYAEVRMYTGVGKCAMGDLVSPAQAKNYARELAMQNAKEQAGVYLTNYTRTTNTKLSAKEITAISNNITEVVGEVSYTQTPGEVNGVPVVVYTATLQANVDTEGIKKYLAQGEKERVAIVQQSNESERNIKASLTQIEKLNEEYGKADSEQEKEKIRHEFSEADRRLLAEQKNREGMALYYKKEYTGAIRLYRQAIDLNPKFAAPWNNLGSAYNTQGNYDKGIECLRKAIDIDPKLYASWSNMGDAYNRLGNYEKAIECCRKAIKLDPDNAFPWNNLGYAYNSLKKYEKAIECCKKAIELDPGLARAWENLSVSYYCLGRYNEALEAIDQSLKLDPDNETVRSNRAYLLQAMG